jgi:hypothetical protein
LLNYSSFGTSVDNCFYGLNLDSKDDNDSDESDSLSNQNEYNEMKMSWNDRNDPNLVQQCKCRYDRSSLEEMRNGFWEGSAILNHGSHIKIGCFHFVFIIVDNTFAAITPMPININRLNNFKPIFIETINKLAQENNKKGQLNLDKYGVTTKTKVSNLTTNKKDNKRKKTFKLNATTSTVDNTNDLFLCTNNKKNLLIDHN